MAGLEPFGRPSLGRVALAIAAALLALFLLVTFLWPLVLTLIVTGAVYYLLAPVVDLGERRGLPRLVTIVLAYSVLLASLALALSTLVPRLYAQLETLAADLPEHADRLEERLAGLGFAGGAADDRLRDAVHSIVGNADEIALGAVSYALGTLGGLVGSLVAIIFGLVAAFYLLLSAPSLSEALLRWVPVGERDRWTKFARGASDVLAGYLRARVLASIFVGAAYGIAFGLIGIEHALLLGVVGGVLNLVPVLGPLLAGIPAVAVAAFQGWGFVLAVLVVMVVAQQVESAVVNPHVEGRYVQLSPFVVVLAAATGAAVAGIAGLLLATPIAGICRVALEVFYRDRLVEQDGGSPPLREDARRVTLRP